MTVLSSRLIFSCFCNRAPLELDPVAPPSPGRQEPPSPRNDAEPVVSIRDVIPEPRVDETQDVADSALISDGGQDTAMTDTNPGHASDPVTLIPTPPTQTPPSPTSPAPTPPAQVPTPSAQAPTAQTPSTQAPTATAPPPTQASPNAPAPRPSTAPYSVTAPAPAQSSQQLTRQPPRLPTQQPSSSARASAPIRPTPA